MSFKEFLNEKEKTKKMGDFIVKYNDDGEVEFTIKDKVVAKLRRTPNGLLTPYVFCSVNEPETRYMVDALIKLAKIN